MCQTCTPEERKPQAETDAPPVWDEAARQLAAPAAPLPQSRGRPATLVWARRSTLGLGVQLARHRFPTTPRLYRVAGAYGRSPGSGAGGGGLTPVFRAVRPSSPDRSSALRP